MVTRLEMHASEHHFSLLFENDLEKTACISFQKNQCAIYSLPSVPAGKRNASLTVLPENNKN